MFPKLQPLIAAASAFSDSLLSNSAIRLQTGDDRNGAFGGFRPTKPTFYKAQARAKFKAQRIARRAQRKGA